MTEPEKKKPEVLDTAFMRRYKERGKNDWKVLLVVGLILVIAFGAFAFWIVKRLDEVSYSPCLEQARPLLSTRTEAGQRDAI